MNRPPQRRTRAGAWHNSASPISTTVAATSTDDPLASLAILPMPTLDLVFGGDDHGDIKLTRAFASPQPRREPVPAAEFPAYCPVDRDRPSLDHPHRIELSIDSLPNYMLIEPIPVAIDPVGDTAYTAWVHNLDTNATGNSVIEALLLLKERLEFVYDDLNKRPHLDNDQKTTLQILHTYIAPKRPEWV
ncbi:MAG TPA: hypothetical protein VG651_24375 [Stellaceae bacterium]|nr:hypothetical protein [Stellaceae bacterium]